MQAFGSLTLSQIEHEKRRTSRVDFDPVIRNVAEMFQKFAEQRKVDVQLELCVGNPYLRASEAAIESLMTNLITNSLRAFEFASPRNRVILLRTIIPEESTFLLTCLDNGPGIQGINLNDVRLPGETTIPRVPASV